MSLQSEVMRFWEMGQYDTEHIADKLRVEESEVYRILSQRPLKERPKPPRKPYAGYPSAYDNRFASKSYRRAV